MIRKHTRGKNSGLFIWSAICEIGKHNVSEYHTRNHKSFCCVIKRKYRHTCCTLPECSKSLFPVYFSGSVNNSRVRCLPCSCYNLWKGNKCVSFKLKVKFKILMFSNCSWSRFNFTIYFMFPPHTSIYFLLPVYRKLQFSSNPVMNPNIINYFSNAIPVRNKTDCTCKNSSQYVDSQHILWHEVGSFLLKLVTRNKWIPDTCLWQKHMANHCLFYIMQSIIRENFKLPSPENHFTIIEVLKNFFCPHYTSGLTN